MRSRAAHLRPAASQQAKWLRRLCAPPDLNPKQVEISRDTVTRVMSTVAASHSEPQSRDPCRLLGFSLARLVAMHISLT